MHGASKNKRFKDNKWINEKTKNNNRKIITRNRRVLKKAKSTMT